MTQKKSITVRASGTQHTFQGDPQLHLTSIGTYFVTLHDAASPGGRSVVWSQRVEDGRVEGVEITLEGFDLPEGVTDSAG